MPSMHVPATQVPPVQTPSTQSTPARQCFPVSHAGHGLPPQSTSVSFPFLTPSLHAATSPPTPDVGPTEAAAPAPEVGPLKGLPAEPDVSLFEQACSTAQIGSAA